MNCISNSTIINVCITPPADIGRKCIKYSQSLKSNNTIFVLDGKNKFAHSTVFMARFPDDKIKEIISAVKTIVKNLQSFFCEHTGYFMTEGRYFEASYKKSKELISLHEALIDSLKNYRLDPGKPVYENYFAPYTKEQQKNAKKTGYDLAYNLYRPHITLTRYREDGIPKDTPIFPTDLSFKADGICVYKADENGAVFELLESFNIK